VRDLGAGMVLFALMSCVGCSAAQDGNAASAVVRVDDVTFNRPWAADFAELYQHASGEDVRRALRDGVITAGEYRHFEHAIEECLDGRGVSARFSRGQWLYERPADVPDDEVDRCLEDNGATVMALRDSVLQNPEHIDESESMARCLVREGAVAPMYDAQDYARELESGAYSFDIESEAFSKCLDAPVGGRRD
jgi:hypothetical protein